MYIHTYLFIEGLWLSFHQVMGLFPNSMSLFISNGSFSEFNVSFHK